MGKLESAASDTPIIEGKVRTTTDSENPKRREVPKEQFAIDRFGVLDFRWEVGIAIERPRPKRIGGALRSGLIELRNLRA